MKPMACTRRASTCVEFLDAVEGVGPLRHARASRYPLRAPVRPADAPSVQSPSAAMTEATKTPLPSMLARLICRSHPSRPARPPALPDDRHLDEAPLLGGMIDPLRCLAVIARFGPEDVRNEGLRVAVVEGEPARLDLHHDAVPRQENVVG